MQLSQLLSSLPTELTPRLRGGDPVIRGLSYDSRSVEPGDLFVALRGAITDGHAYLAQAVALGAVALLVESEPDEPLGDAAVAAVPDTRRALAPIATRFYGSPGDELRLIGITGTNGKTSTSALVESILEAAGIPAGLIGTLGVRYAGEHEPAVNTTPESLDLQRTLRSMCTRGVRAVAMEVSSHGLSLGRVHGCRFEVGAFTNFTQDHLDFHDTMESYRGAKTRLFSDHLGPSSTAVINIDDPAAESFEAAARVSGARILRVSQREDADAEVRVERADVELGGTRARLQLPSGTLDLHLPLVGSFNVENLAVAVAAAVGLGIAPHAIAKGVGACPQVPGRTERVGSQLRNAPTVLVDYAHTPDAVEKLLQAVRPLARGRLITVFGCGGDRDRSKRPLMAEAVARYSDRAVATSDNPRTEDPVLILRDVEAGLVRLQKTEPLHLDDSAGSYAVVVDRREAIGLAIGIARPEDTVVLAGKGHEDYQIVGREKLPFDDREEAERALRVGRA